jgi:hypothetical protein
MKGKKAKKACETTDLEMRQPENSLCTAHYVLLENSPRTAIITRLSNGMEIKTWTA